ncbi:MAG: hypothetical protein HYZ66_06320 [Chlamydiae bacterium]|nr:hypothetical protein [Chlamydiota bacterium]
MSDVIWMEVFALETFSLGFSSVFDSAVIMLNDIKRKIKRRMDMDRFLDFVPLKFMCPPFLKPVQSSRFRDHRVRWKFSPSCFFVVARFIPPPHPFEIAGRSGDEWGDYRMSLTFITRGVKIRQRKDPSHYGFEDWGMSAR